VSQAGGYLTLAVLVLAFYLLLIRPARRRAVAAQRLQSSLVPGDEVMLTSGMFAKVVDLTDEVATVELSPGVVVRVHRRAVGQVIQDQPSPSDDETRYDDAPSTTGEIPGDEQPGVN
jgi:preprotein translocase subunit YajC